MNTVSLLVDQSSATKRSVVPLPTAGYESCCKRATVTVVMCDIVESTRLSTSLPVEAFRELLLQYYRICGEIVRSHGGLIVHYVGDGILSVFGDTSTRDGTAFHAVRAGLKLVRVDFKYSHHRYAVRVAASTGVVATGQRVGSDAALQEPVFGQTPYVASRLQALASPRTLVVDSSTHSLVRSHFDTSEVGWFDLRGFCKQFQVWKVDGMKDLEPSHAERGAFSL